MRRRTVLASTFAAAAGTALTRPFAAAARATTRPLCFVVNSGEATVSIIDMTARREIERVPLLREPHHLVLTPDRQSVLVGDTVGNSLFFLDPYSGKIQRRLAAPDPYQLMFSPDQRVLVTTGLARDQVDIYDAGSYQPRFHVPAPSMPSHIAYSPDSAIAYISLQSTGQLQAIELATGTTRWSRPVGNTPAGVLWHHDQILVGLMGEAAFAVVNPTTGAVLRKVTTEPGAHTIFPDLTGARLYVTNRVAGSVSVVDPHSLQVLRTIAVPGFPDDLDFAPDGKIWAALRHAHAAGVIDPQTGAIEHIKVGRLPHGIWLNTRLGHVDN